MPLRIPPWLWFNGRCPRWRSSPRCPSPEQIAIQGAELHNHALPVVFAVIDGGYGEGLGGRAVEDHAVGQTGVVGRPGVVGGGCPALPAPGRSSPLAAFHPPRSGRRDSLAQGCRRDYVHLRAVRQSYLPGLALPFKGGKPQESGGVSRSSTVMTWGPSRTRSGSGWLARVMAPLAHGPLQGLPVSRPKPGLTLTLYPEPGARLGRVSEV